MYSSRFFKECSGYLFQSSSLTHAIYMLLTLTDMEKTSTSPKTLFSVPITFLHLSHRILIIFLNHTMSSKSCDFYLVSIWNILTTFHDHHRESCFQGFCQRFPIRVRLLAMCRSELSALIALLMSKCIWSGWKL